MTILIRRILGLSILASGLQIGPFANAKSYTKSELKKMIAAKKYPKTQNPTEKTDTFEFRYCRSLVQDDRMEKDEEGYPTLVVTEKSDLLVIKTWQSHMMTVMTCKNGSLITVDYDYSL